MCPAYTSVDRHINSAPAAAAPNDTLAQTSRSDKELVGAGQHRHCPGGGFDTDLATLQAPLKGAPPQDVT